MLNARSLICLAFMVTTSAPAAASINILFVGNSFTYGSSVNTPNPPVRGYKPYSVHDLNDTSIGGIPALFKEFTVQSGLDYTVSLQTNGGFTLQDHYDKRLKLIDKPWDAVVLQSHSVLDPEDPGNPATLISATGLLANVFTAQNPDVAIYLTATWTRANLTYRFPSPWFGQPIDAMANDIQRGYELAAAVHPNVTDVIEVGGAWSDAIAAGLAVSNPYNPIPPDQINLWGADRYHASVYGSYLSALVQFGTITGRDPRRLGGDETVAVTFGFTSAHTSALQAIAYQRLVSSGIIAVPEPSTWAMLICGFGITGLSMRRRRVCSSLRH